MTRIAKKKKKKKKKNETESWCFEKKNKIYKLLVRLIKIKRKQIQVSKTRNERNLQLTPQKCKAHKRLLQATTRQ